MLLTMPWATPTGGPIRLHSYTEKSTVTLPVLGHLPPELAVHHAETGSGHSASANSDAAAKHVLASDLKTARARPALIPSVNGQRPTDTAAQPSVIVNGR